MKKVLFLFFFASLLSGCFKLDNNLFNPDKKITEYKRDSYTGEQDFILNDSYKIPEHLIHEFTFRSPSGGNNSKNYNIFAVYIGDMSRIGTDTVIMYCHGNKWHMDFYWQRAKLLANIGGKNRFGVLMIDYQGFGLSEGKPSEGALYDNVNDALKWLCSYGLTNDRLLMYGFSLGSAPATMLTANPHADPCSLVPSRLILEAPFASAANMVKDATKLDMPVSFMTNLKINNADEIKKVHQPFLWIHGTKDSFLNIKTHGEVVFKNYSGMYGLPVRVKGAEHSTVPTTMGFDLYSKTILDFITH